jgi:(p)ppGpp synthase/HD superfamily hydrolase
MDIMQDPKVLQALELATEFHKGQLRKYTGCDYIVHPIEVAQIVSTVSDNVDLICACLLHDTLEDTALQLEHLIAHMGPNVARIVVEVTDVSRPEDGNRRVRKAIDKAHLAKASPEGQTLKLADSLSNCQSFLKHDPHYAVFYLAEKRDLLRVLTKGDRTLFGQVETLIREGLASLKKR